MSSRPARLAQVAVLLATASLAGAQPRETAGAAPEREGMEALEARLALAVDRVSLPHAARLLGRAESARGYRLPGYGLVLVLTPRMLPGGEGQFYVLRRSGPKHHVQVETRRSSTGEATWTYDDDQVETFERQVLVLQQESEAARAAAEKEMERMVEDARERVAPPAPPEAPEAPGPPAPPEAPLPPAPPPWKAWFETGAPQDKRTPEAVIADVRVAVIEALVAQGGRRVGLAGDERVTVAVDFVPGGLFAPRTRPQKTLVVTARAKDIDARARGAISLEEFRRRLDASLY